MFAISSPDEFLVTIGSLGVCHKTLQYTAYKTGALKMLELKIARNEKRKKTFA